MGKALGNLCMHVVGKSNRGAAFCLASGPLRQRETKVNFMLLVHFSSYLAASLLFSLGGITFEAQMESRAWAAHLHPSFLRSKHGPSPAAVLSHYFGTKDGLFCKRKTGLRGALFHALSHTEFV